MDERVELELELAAIGEGDYRVTVRSAAGEEMGRLALDPASLLRHRALLQSNVLASAVTSRAVVSELEAPVRELGETLFRALFDDHVYAAYKASLALAAERGTQLRVVLRTQAPELAALPWEMMYDADAAAYLCRREPLVRHVAVSSVTHPLRVTPPLRILGVIAAPTDRPRLDVEDERKRLTAALSPLGSRLALHWVDGGRWADVQRELIAGTWHVLHFVGHGGFDPHHDEGVLALENDRGTSDLVGAERFSDLLTLQERPLQLVVLNSCAGALSAADDLFSSSAATLIRTGVSAVVAMQFAVSDPAAKAFAAGFYQAIAHNRSVAEAVRIGRIGIRGIGENTLEWVTPVVYLRGDDAALFDVLPDLPAGDADDDVAPLSPEEAAREAAAQALYANAVHQLEAHELPDAIALFDLLLGDREDFRDAAALRDRARSELQRIAGDEAERKRLADEDAERTRLADQAERERIAEEQEAERSRIAKADAERRRREERRRRRRTLLTYVAAPAAALLVVGGAIALLWPSAPEPFRSAALYELARHHFDPGDCHVPTDRDEAPLLFDLDHTELLVCERPDEAYNGALFCMGDQAAFESVRDDTLLHRADNTATVSDAPAGRDEPWPFQVSFNDVASGAGRVFWDDEDSGCGVLLRTSDTDVEDVLGHFATGSGS